MGTSAQPAVASSSDNAWVEADNAAASSKRVRRSPGGRVAGHGFRPCYGGGAVPRWESTRPTLHRATGPGQRVREREPRGVRLPPLAVAAAPSEPLEFVVAWPALALPETRCMTTGERRRRVRRRNRAVRRLSPTGTATDQSTSATRSHGSDTHTSRNARHSSSASSWISSTRSPRSVSSQRKISGSPPPA